MFRVCSLVLLFFLFFTCFAEIAEFLERPAPDFSRHSIVQPIVQHARTKRNIATTKEESGVHHLNVTMTIVVDGKEYILDLQLNKELVTDNYVLSYQKNGETFVYKPNKEEIDLCQYKGSVRGKTNSWVALSTCHGVQGVVYDGTKLRYIEPAQGIGGRGNISSKHYLYDHADLSEWRHCGHVSNTTKSSMNITHIYNADESIHNSKSNRYKRYIRQDMKIHEPYNANKQSLYVELVLVADNAEFRANRGDISTVHNRMKTLANIVNSIYSALNIYIALVGVVVWSEGDQIQLDSDGDRTLNNFLQYRARVLVKNIPNDNAHLLTRQEFLSNVIGKATVNGMCSYGNSGGVENIHTQVLGLLAATIAHEMGHNFGMEHDTDGLCDCPDQKCIMSPSSTSITPVHWSSCSLKALVVSFSKGIDYCLRDKPEHLFHSSLCGNGFVEPNEECDCGSVPVAGSNNPCHACCEPKTCRLRSNATCAAGTCCDLQTCRPKSAGTVCRDVERECDLPEYCTGSSEYCPDNVYNMDSTPCGKGEQSAYCVSGHCRSHMDRCRLVWGITGKNGHHKCYDYVNRNGKEGGHCGYDREKNIFTKCKQEDVLCGVLHCSHFTNKPQITSKTLYTTSITVDDAVVMCHSADVNIQSQDTDLGMAPDGAKCGEEKMCLKQKCVSVAEVRKKIAKADSSVCPSNCSGHGVCNSAGHCHCESGFAPPLCAEPGYGGSYESSFATDPIVSKRIMIALYAIFLGIVPSLLLVICLIHYFHPKSLLHCHDAMQKIKKYFEFKPNSPQIYANNEANKSDSFLKQRKENDYGNHKSNISSEHCVNIEPVYSINQPIYTNSNVLNGKKKVLRKINKNDIQIVSQHVTQTKTIDKEDIQMKRKSIGVNNIVITNENNTPTTRKKITKNDIQIIKLEKEKNSAGKDDISIGNENNNVTNVNGRKKIAKDNSDNVINGSDKICKKAKEVAINIDIASIACKNDIHTTIKTVSTDEITRPLKIKRRENESTLKSGVIKKKLAQTENNLPKDTKTGVSVRDLASTINSMAVLSQDGISNRTKIDTKIKGTMHIVRKPGLKKQ